MIKVTPTTKTPIEIIVDGGITCIKAGRTIEAVMLKIERDPVFHGCGFSAEEVKEFIEFWAGQPKAK